MFHGQGRVADCEFPLMHWSRIVLPAVCALALLASARAKSSGGVLLITIDTLRADHLGCYGYRGGATATMDALAKEGVKFEHAFAPVPLTLPSHAALLTGTYPFYNGVRDQPGFRLPDDIPTLAEYFSRAGYATAAVLGSPVLARRFGLSRGFEDYDDRFGASTEEQEAGLADIKRPAASVVRLALAWLDGQTPGKPFFLWLHFYDPHLPYRAPEPFRSRFADRPYDGEIAYTDAALATLFAGLRSRWLFDSTVIALTADHGEGLGDHGESTHGYFIYDSTLRVPLLVKPGSNGVPALRAAGGERKPDAGLPRPDGVSGKPGAATTQAADIQTSVSLADLAPTLLRLAGIQAPSSMQGTDFSGSVLSGEEPRPHPVYAETMYPLLHLGWNPLRALIMPKAGERAPYPGHKIAPLAHVDRLGTEPAAGGRSSLADLKVCTSRWEGVKYIQAPQPELYDLCRDPREARNQYSWRQAEAAAERDQLEAFVSTHAPAKPSSARTPVSAETAELFASLGYVGEVGAAAPAFTTSRRDPKDGVGEHEELLRAAHAFQARQYDVATRVLGEVLKKDPQQPLALDYLGTTQLLRRDLTQARATYTRLLQAAPYYATACVELGHTEALLGSPAEAKRLYRRAVEMDPSNPRPLRELGILLLDEGKVEQAEKLLQQSLKLDATDVFALNALGEAAARQEHYQDAAAILQRALDVAPRAVPVRLNLGFVYLQLKRFTDAERLMGDTIQLDPSRAQAYAELGTARLESANSAGAREAFRRALALEPRNPMALQGARRLGLAPD
jgi:arylsulfatase A-like enzyme/tetratricopeptide (TPR) repeat protein